MSGNNKRRELSDPFLTVAYRSVRSCQVNFSYKLYQLSSSLQAARTRESINSSDPLSSQKLSNITFQEKEQAVQWLRGKLRKFPYWLNGHRFLALTSLELGDTATAYASAQAMSALAKSKHRHLEAQKIIGKCYLKQSQFDKAIKSLSSIQESIQQSASEKDYEVNEDLAASYMALDNNKEAKRLLDDIPPARISKEGASALEYLKNKT